MRFGLSFVSTFCAPLSVRACDIALLLAVDVSGSVDEREFGVQMGGLATALRDGVVAEALVTSNARLALVQWTGSTRQVTTIAWAEIKAYEDVLTFADRVQNDRRQWRNYSTAIGEALEHSVAEFDSAQECARHVIDVSGDGRSNEGVEPALVRDDLARLGITVNALVIEGGDEDLTGYFWENVITGEGAFVVTANGFDDYPDRIRQKLIREITKQLALGQGPSRGSKM